MEDLNEMYTRIDSSFKGAEAKRDETSYMGLQAALKELDSILREHIQGITMEEVSRVIGKLEEGKELSQEELGYIRLWVVGDAQHYTELENNFKDWLSELARLEGEIEKCSRPTPDLKTSSRLRALLADGIHTLQSMVYFLMEKERLERFEEATKELDKGERDILIRILKDKMASPER